MEYYFYFIYLCFSEFLFQIFFVYHFEITLPFLFQTQEILQIYGNFWKPIYKFLEISEQRLYPASSFAKTKGTLYVSVLWKK